MTASDPHNLPVYRFGAFELDCARRELRRRGEVVPIQPKAFELLRYLVEHRDRAVDKEELQDALWPRSIVTETSLTRSVMKARRAVGDDSGRQAVIRTVHGHGYRFVAALDEGEEPAAVVAPAEPAVAAEPAEVPAVARKRNWLPLAAVAMLVVAVLAWWGASREADGASMRVAVLPVVNDTGKPELEWVATGLMSLVNRLLQNHGIDVVAERPVLALVEAGGELAATLQQTERATHLLESKLGFEDGIYRLEFTVRGLDGSAESRTAVANEPAGMVPAVAESVARLLAGSRYTDARRRAVSDDPFINEAYARALSLEFAGRLEEAKRLFQVVIEQDPELFWPRYEYALCARNLRKWDVAVPLLEELIAEAEADGAIAEQAAAMNSLGVLHYSRDEFDSARRLFEEVRRLAETFGDFERLVTAHVNLALIARATGDTGLAAAYLEKAIEISHARGVESLPGTLTNNLS
ncbi:MAG TPA: winged helix-turn-helix domain-containing protein, partial [Woeseiaceae bacterium]|nr:winged helix-turn-helix domain-containing protein [Woeseiaceae bacterium]